MTTISRRLLLRASTAVGMFPLVTNAQTSSWPNRTVHFVVPFAPGGTTDYVTRLVATEVAKTLSQPIVVDNKPGAGTVVGVDFVAKSTPDGTNFVTIANSFCANQTLVRKLPYDTLKDLRPVALMGMSEHVLATHPGTGIRSIADLRAFARARPGALSYASFGNGTSAHLSGALLAQQMGIEMIHLPYKGQGPALADLLGGQVSLMFGNWPELRSHIQSGKLVALGMATSKRSTYAPDIPTLQEQGVVVESNSWNGLLAPAGTGDQVVLRMNEAVNRAMEAPSVFDAFKRGGITSLAQSPQQFADFIKSEIAKYAEVIRKGNISLEV